MAAPTEDHIVDLEVAAMGWVLRLHQLYIIIYEHTVYAHNPQQ